MRPKAGHHFVLALAGAVLCAQAAVGDLAVIRCWRWRGAGEQLGARACCWGRRRRQRTRRRAPRFRR